MKQVRATDLLPEELLLEIQKYVDGEILYIPKRSEKHCKWGSRSGGRKYIDERNQDIRELFQNGTRIDDLADMYCLSPETIKKIVYSKQ
ncbi:CD3324 family protein [Radiobacillus deserti]|uniref:Mor transcription activator domain-containing protein n=1 Tax=Radiobacillus deserti TaxID=2594883 RepID=A0A516KC77_9BACI|nr:CD3324 family protein [Radiobacillus deserti]QDP39005.1 hypothetical protein FN924_01510 [Radiobacillus deserti]